MLEKSKEFLSNDQSDACENGELDDHFEYPSIGRLFSGEDPQRLKALRDHFESAKTELDLVVRKGSAEEAGRASRALRAITLTLEFLETLENRNNS